MNMSHCRRRGWFALIIFYFSSSAIASLSRSMLLILATSRKFYWFSAFFTPCVTLSIYSIVSDSSASSSSSFLQQQKQKVSLRQAHQLYSALSSGRNKTLLISLKLKVEPRLKGMMSRCSRKAGGVNLSERLVDDDIDAGWPSALF